MFSTTDLARKSLNWHLKNKARFTANQLQAQQDNVMPSIEGRYPVPEEVDEFIDNGKVSRSVTPEARGIHDSPFQEELLGHYQRCANRSIEQGYIPPYVYIPSTVDESRKRGFSELSSSDERTPQSRKRRKSSSVEITKSPASETETSRQTNSALSSDPASSANLPISPNARLSAFRSPSFDSWIDELPENLDRYIATLKSKPKKLRLFLKGFQEHQQKSGNGIPAFQDEQRVEVIKLLKKAYHDLK